MVICTDFDYRETAACRYGTRASNSPATSTSPRHSRIASFAIGPTCSATARAASQRWMPPSIPRKGNAAQEGRLAEQLRLAYVGTTRARDRLMHRPAEQDRRDTAQARASGCRVSCRTSPSPPASSSETTLPGDIAIPTRVEKIDAVQCESEQRSPINRAGSSNESGVRKPAASCQPSSLPPVAAEVGQIIDFGQRIPLLGKEMTDVGNGLHAVIAAEFVNPLAEQERRPPRQGNPRQPPSRRPLEPRTDALAAARRFQRSPCRQYFAPSRIEVEAPLHHELDDGRAVRGLVDLVAETEHGWLIVDHKSSPQRKSTWREEALKHSGQLDAYRSVLEAAGRRVAACYIHFAVTGGLVEVKFG